MKKKYFKFYFYYIPLILFLNKILLAEPIIVLEYGANKNTVEINNDNNFVKDENYSVVHKVKRTETLSTIMEKYYGNSNLNLMFIQSAIVHKNKNVFVRSNPNFMFAGKNLYLPSINEIKNLVYKKQVHSKPNYDKSQNTNIYFFGN